MFLNNLKLDLASVMDWFHVNHLVANPNKFQMMILGANNIPMSSLPSLEVVGITILPSESVKLLGITLDKSLTFSDHISNLCVTASRNLRCLARLRNFLTIKQAMLLYNAFIKSVFGYCPLIWMFCQKGSYKKIELIQKRSLRVVFNDNILSLSELYEKEGIFPFHTMHLRLLITEIFKTLNNLNPSFMKQIFPKKEVFYNLRVSNLLSLPVTKTVRYGSNSVFFRGCLLWNSLPDDIKKTESLSCFKGKLSALGGLACTCKMCK